MSLRRILLIYLDIYLVSPEQRLEEELWFRELRRDEGVRRLHTAAVPRTGLAHFRYGDIVPGAICTAPLVISHVRRGWVREVVKNCPRRYSPVSSREGELTYGVRQLDLAVVVQEVRLGDEI